VEIRGDLLLELLGLKLKSLEQSEPRSREDLEDVRYSVDFGGGL